MFGRHRSFQSPLWSHADMGPWNSCRADRNAESLAVLRTSRDTGGVKRIPSSYLEARADYN